jgi:hypothetical protein
VEPVPKEVEQYFEDFYKDAKTRIDISEEIIRALEEN